MHHILTDLLQASNVDWIMARFQPDRAEVRNHLWSFFVEDALSSSKVDIQTSRRELFAGSVAGILAVQAAFGQSAIAELPAEGNLGPTLDRRFLPGSIDEATRRVNAIIEADDADLKVLSDVNETRKLWNGPPAWPANVAAAGTPGMKLLPMPPKSAVSEKLIPGPSKPVRLLILQPPGKALGTYFYVHGGGWVAQKPEDYLPFLWKFCREAEVVIVAPEYRLAPEHPFPAGPDDVLAAARWLFTSGQNEFHSPFVMGGDSAGGHLAALTLQRLRDEANLTPFVGADLVYGAYDFNLTPSVRRHGPKLPLSSDMVKMCVDWACPPGMDRFDPKVSPLYGGVEGMPPALFTVGTHDPLLDDTLFMEQRWRAAGRGAILDVYPGGVHGFDWLPLDISARSLDRRVQFLSSRIRPA